MKRVLVTGGLGFIGSHTAVELQVRGYQCVIADNLTNTQREVQDGIAAITGTRPEWTNVDLADPAACRAFLQSQPKFDGIIHFAAFKAVGESVQKPLDYYRNNLGSLLNLLDYVRANVDCAFIFSSSCTVYGQADELPIREHAAIKPAESPYGNTKQIGEEILRDGASAHGFRAIALRYFNPIGAHPSAKIGELPIGVPQNLVPFLTQSACGMRGTLKVFGNDYKTRDGTCIRDYIHVVDLSQAHIAAMERLMQNKAKEAVEVFNLGTGTGSSVLEVIAAFERASGKRIAFEFAPRRAGDVVAAYADTTKATEVLGWRASRSLDQCMADAWRWQLTLKSN
ncbi:UDP-glucose 4-epimerase [Planctomycetota bacterium]|nr:UDP-glucose 4-epimerase GalE [Planctomycetota bacterium]GDY02743.1 UDP-glucose 4-epimerase [Planctomycetota bacterium]